MLQTAVELKMNGGQTTTVTVSSGLGAISLPSSSRQHLSTNPNTPPARFCSVIGQNFSVDTLTYKGPTILSAPSVEQADYRTPRPSIPAIQIGKSFDLDRQQQMRASDSNGLIKVRPPLLLRQMRAERKCGKL
ncbi:Kcnl-3 [Aphelenchoides fujianensis]|nr:Kcnl-3 [Aphelenchoides fujianensis]